MSGEKSWSDFDLRDELRHERIAMTFSKVLCVYPHIKTHADLLKTTVESLMSHSNTQVLKRKDENFNHGSIEEFRLLVRPYLDSSYTKGAKGESFARWPLVRRVQIWSKAPVLAFGLVLVDLPGTGDSNIARSSVSRNEVNKLKLVCVCGAATRASSS